MNDTGELDFAPALFDDPIIQNGGDDQLHLYHPYLNKSLFLLGDWYWNHGSQKSHQSFSDLLHIIEDPDFKPTDVQLHTKWATIDIKLGQNDFDGNSSGDEAEWLDDDTGWQHSPISISIPFHSRMDIPGTQDYVVGDLYHQPLVSVICEKLTNPADDQHFHYEPFELFWSPTNTVPDI